MVWGDQVWLTTANDDGTERIAVCVDRNSGRIVHRATVFDVPEPEECYSLNSFASPSPVIEEGRIYVYFGTNGIACLDTASARTIWSRRDFHLDHLRGPGSSPTVFGDLVLFHCDGIDVQYVVALNKSTGKTVWRVDRSFDFSQLDPDVRKAYCTPRVAELAGRTQMISSGAKATMAYDPLTGRELWQVRYAGYSNVSRPLVGHGLTFINTGFGKPELWAVRGDGRGDVTETHVAWKYARSVPAKPSIVMAGEWLLMVSDRGIATCLDAKTGRAEWTERLGGNFSASVVHAQGRVYACSQEGKTIVFRAADRFEKLAENQLDGPFMASPAIAGKALFLRTKTHLYRIEE